MKTSLSRVQQFLLQASIPVLCSVAVGFLFYQDNIFNRHYGAFQFVWSAVVASLLYYTLVFLRLREFLLAFVLLFFLTLVTTQSTLTFYVLRDVFYTGAIGLSVYLYFTYFRGHAAGNYAYTPLLFAGLYGVVSMVCAELDLAVYQALVTEGPGAHIAHVAPNMAFFGVTIGFAVGCGITLNERLWGTRKKPSGIVTA